MVSFKSLSLALLTLTATSSAGIIHRPRAQLEHPGCKSTPDCHKGEMCYKPGPADWPYGACIPEGKNATQPGDPDAPQLGYPSCQVVKDCNSEEICYKPGSDADAYGVCIRKGQTKGE